MNIEDIAVKQIVQLQPYVPGKPISELQREYGLKDVIKLASNENPLGPSQAVVAAIALTARESTRYPDGNGFDLKQALSRQFGIEAAQITLGNGSNDVLELITRCFAQAGDEVIFSQHAFAVYPISTQAVGATAVEVPAIDFGHDLDAMLAAITPQTKLIFIANPNNPTGTYLEPARVKTFLSQVPEHVIVVLDEAYLEYSEPTEDTLSWLALFPNLVITRTFSKAYGLAGLRVGYAASSVEVASLLNRLRQPFNVNSLALAAAVAALGDQDYLARTKHNNDAGMRQFIDGFVALGLNYIPSKGNFICVDVGQPAGIVYEGLLREGVIVRPVAGYGMPHHLRISIGLATENERCLIALKSVLGK